MLVDPLINEPLQFLSLHWAEARKEEQTHLNILMRPQIFQVCPKNGCFHWA